MAQPVQQIPIRAPGFQGLNTELSPMNGDPEFALVADNVVVDQIGRLISRKAFADYATFPSYSPYVEFITIARDISSLGAVQSQYDYRPVMIHRWSDQFVYPVDGRTVPVGMSRRRAVKNGSPELGGTIGYGVSTIENDAVKEMTVPEGYDNQDALLTASFVNFSAEDLTAGNDRFLLFCKDKPFLRLESDKTFEDAGAEWKDEDGNSNPIDGDIAVSAYGRVWVTGVGGDYHQIHYSSLLDETTWYDASATFSSFNDAGVIDVREYWPVDGDSIVGIHAHNGFLVVFGRNSILLYGNADSGSPAGIINQPDQGIFLQDTISNVGLIRREAVCNIGTDLLFVDDSGVRSLGRVIQEKSTPLQEPSLNIRREIQAVIKTELGKAPSFSSIKLEYIPSESLAVLLFTSLKIAYAFHLSTPSKTGGLKVTRWTDCCWNDSIELKQGEKDVVLLAGKAGKGVLKYDGYLEGINEGTPDPYVMRYESMALAIGSSPMQISIPKSVQFICMGEFIPGQANALWGFSDRFIDSCDFQIEIEGGSKFDIDEFSPDTTSEKAGYYPDGGPYYNSYKVNTTGSGQLFRVGMEVKVQGGRYALQEININAAIGRLTA